MAQAIQLPDGTYFPIKQGERPDDAYRAAMQLYPSAFAPQQPEQPKPEAEGGFFPALKAGYSALKSDVAGLAGRSGLMDLAEAEKYIAGEKQYQAETFKPTTESFAEAPLTNIKELLGGSLPYMAAPLVAGGAAAAAAPASAVAGIGAAGLASLAQFTGSNLSRQVEDGGKTLGETDITNAALAAIPQTVLDIISLRMIPGLGKILEGAGIKLAKEEVKNFAEEALKQTVTDYALKTGKTMGVEGLTEASQQIFERAQAGLNITDPEARQEYFDSFIGGAVLGGVIAPAGRYFERGQAQTRYDMGEAVKQQTAQQEQLKLDALAAAEEERKKSSPEYFQTLSTKYKAAEQAKNDLIAQKRKIVAGSETETADRLHNTEITAQLKEMSPGVQALAAEYNRLLKVQPKADETTETPAIKPNLAVGDTLDNPLGNFTKEELASRAPTVAKYIDAERKKAGKPALESYSIEDIRNAMPNQLPEAEQADLSSLIAAKTGHTGDITYKPTDVLEVAKQKNIDTTTDGFKDFLRRATGDAEIEQLTQPQLHSAFKALSSLPRFDEPQILPAKRNATDYSKEQYDKAVAALQKLVEDRKSAADQGQKTSNVELTTIPYETTSFAGVGQPLQRSSGQSNIIDLGGRKIVLINVNGVQVPYYLSTGSGGKVDVPAGKWYPFFGVGKDGWINKTGGKEMADYYGSPALRDAAQTLDRQIGDIRNDNSVQRVSGTGPHIDAINAGFNPSENSISTTLKTVRGNIDNLINKINSNQAQDTTSETENKKPIAKPVSIAEANAVIKAQTGLKNDADVQTLFRDANRNGDIDFKGDEVTYRQKGAQAEFNIEEGFAPAEGTGFNVMRNGEMLFATNDEAEATAKAEKLGKDAKPAISQIDKSIAKENSTVADSQKALDAMEAEGKFNTPQYTQAAARHAGVVDKANKTIESLNAKKQMLQKPVTVQKAGKPTNRKTFTVKEKGVEEKAFNTREEAERHALENLPEERLNELSTQTKAPGFANRLKKEQERRKKPVLALPAPKPPTPKGPSAEATALQSKLLPMLRKFGLGNVALKIEEAMVDEGSYGANVITVALDAANPVRVLRHETIHGLKDLGFFTPGQWSILENQADKVWIDKYLRQRNRSGGPLKEGEQSRYEAYEELYNKDMDKIREEAISDAFADFDVNGAPKGLFTQLLDAMRKFFRNLRFALNGAGYETAEDIFGKVERGELKATKAAESEEAKPSLRTAEEGVPFSTRAIMEQNTAFAQNELGLETVKKKGAANSNNVRDVAIALNNKTLQEYGRMDEKNHSPEDVQRIADAMADEVSYQLTTKSKTGTGTGWYSYNYPNAVKLLAARFPELAESQYARSVFSALVAVTSNGERVDKNIDNAIKLYADLRMGKPLVAMGNRRPTALEKNLVAIQSLMNEHGEENFENELRREITVREMNVFLRSKGEKTNNDYLANSRVPAAAIYFGPKLGAFYANLSGSEGYLTMDLWWTRSINRMRGLLIPRATEASIDKFREMMGMPEATREEVVAASIPLRNKYKEYGYTTELEHLVRSKEPDTNAKKPAWTAKAKRVAGSAYPQLEFEHRLEKMANTIHKNEYEMLEEAPFGAGDRKFMYDAAKKAQSILAKDGIKLTLADIQAALWYYEKRLYAKLTGRTADDIGYEEAIIAKSREGTGRERPSVVFSGQPYRRDVGTRESQLPDERGQGDDQKRASLRTAVQSYRGRNEESPDSHTRRGFRSGEGVRVLGRESIAAYAPTEDFKNTVGEFDHQSPTFYEMSPKDADVFRGAIEQSKLNNKYGASVGVYSEDEYAKMRTFLTQDGKAGFALKGNDIVSVFSSPEHKGSASSSLQLAVQEGGRKLDAFDTVLPQIYYENGFKVTGRSRWNEEYIPDNWNKQTFQKFNNGEPDVVYMVYDPENDTPPSVKSPDQYFEDYDDLIKAQDDAVEKYFNEGAGYGTKEQNQRAREFKAEAERLPKQGGVRRSVRLLDDETRAKYPYVEEPVEGLPAKAKVDGVEVTFGPYVPAREAAILHAEQSGIPYRQQASYYKIDPAFSKRLADAFLQMKDNPSAPEVKAAYDAWADETIAQYKAMLKTGITIEFMPNNRDPYGNPRNAILDVINNNHLYVFPADGGFGSAAITEEQIKKNPALALTDIMISGRPARVVEVFRATHDFYGHVKEGFGFRAEGEENAFQSHVRMYSPLAARAMTAGTRGQNSVVNFGPYAEFNKTASGEETKYADQKIGLLPQWATDTNITPDVRASLRGKETIGINVNQDGNNKYADKIVDGKKTFETRDTDSLRPYVGQRVAIVKTGEGKAKAIGAVTIGEPILVTSRKDFDKYRNQTLVPKGSRFDIADDGVKYLYPMGNPERYKQEIDVGLGIVSRKLMQERASLRTAPDWVSQNIWDLHEKVNRAEDLASGRVASDLRPQDLKREQTMSFRRLNKAVEDYVGKDFNKVNALMVRMNEETGRREREQENREPARASLRTNVKNDLSTMPNGAAILATMNRVTPPREKKGFAERVINALAPEAWSYFRQNFLDRYNRLNDYDKMVAQQMGGVELLADQSAHWASLNSDMAAGVTASALGVGDRMGGAPVLKNGYVTVDNLNGTVKGVLEILSPLASRGDPDIYRLYQLWSAAKRGTRLYREGRFELLTPAEVKDALTLSQKYPEFVTVQQDWIKYNNALVKLQVDAGVITPAAGAEFMKYSDYIPLYRQMDGSTTLGPSVYQSISGVKPPKTLKGKGDAPIEDYLETIVRNTQAAIQSSMKNLAAQKAVKNGMILGMVVKLPAVSSAPDTITILENGKKVSYQCADKLFIEAVSSLNLPELPFLSILSAPADLLRALVTKDPGFMLANMMRDSLSAYVTSGANIKPVISTVKNFGAAIMNRSPVYQALLNSGAIGGYEYSRNVEAGAEAFAADLRKKTGTQTKSEQLFKPFANVWGFLERGTEASDAATRMAVYEATLKETGNEAEAIRRAVEVLNFNRKGRSAIVRIAAAAIPFLNARVQGLDVFFRAGIRPFYDKNSTAYEKQVQKAMLIRGATMMALSTMYAAAIMGDPDYEKQEQETKDNNWLIPSLGIKIPIPFEVGTLFKTIPERIYRYSYGSDTSKDLGDSMKRALLSTFAFNPVPQAIAPILEAQYNYSVFTQRPIVGEAMRNIAPEFQVGPSTTKIAEFLGKQTGMSPIMLDHVYKGYTGTMGMYLADVMDAVFTAGSDNPKASQRFEQTPVLKRFLLDSDARGQVSAYYDLKNSVDQTVRTVNLLAKQGSPDLEGYIEKNISMYGMRGYVSSVDKQMQKLSAQAAMIRSTPMPAEEKRKMLDEVTRLQNDLTNEIQLIRKMARP